MTPDQRNCLDALKRLTVDGVSPSYVELAAALGVKSKSGVFRRVAELERLGLVSVDRWRSRGIIVIADNPAYTAAALDALTDNALSNLVDAATAALAARRRSAA